ncbi:AAA domain protein [uncultured archaeon]|nr:AAA domain protein [uncultured archaeon]
MESDKAWKRPARAKRFVIYVSAPSCAGKSTLTAALAKRMPDLYTVSYDKLKWQLSGYHRGKHKGLIRELTIGLLEVVCRTHIPVLLDLFLKDEAEYLHCGKIAKRYGYGFVTIKLTAPKSVLVQRFRERVANAKKTGTKISVTDEDLFVKNLSTHSFAPADAPLFDTSITDADYIADKILRELV